MNVCAYIIKPNPLGTVDIQTHGQEPITALTLECLEYLADTPSELSVCWALDDTVAPLLGTLGKDLCQELWKKGKCFLRPYSIFYIPGKVLTVHRVGAKCKLILYGIDQFYPDRDEPEGTDELQKLAEDVIAALAEMGLEATKLTSAIAVYEEQQMRHFSLPTGRDMPKEAAYMAWQCAGRLWIENFQMGYWEKAYDYDMRSAFPAVARTLVDLRLLDWAQSAEVQPGAIYGYAKCEVKIHESVMVHPIIYQNEQGESSCPTGWWGTWLTKHEIEFIREHEVGEVEIQDGWWATLQEKKLPLYPLAIPLDRVFQWKETGSDLVKGIAKRILVGNFYGRFGEERKREFGPHWNPCYFAEISSQTRLRVAQFLYDHGVGPGDNEGYRHLLHVSVDGVLTDAPLVIPETNGIGSWKLDSVSSALVISSGLLYLGGKHPKGLWLEDVLEMIREHPQRPYYERAHCRMVTLGEALNNDKLEELGTVKDFFSTIDLLALQQDRVFPERPRTGAELLSKKYLARPEKVWEV